MINIGKRRVDLAPVVMFTGLPHHREVEAPTPTTVDSLI